MVVVVTSEWYMSPVGYDKDDRAGLRGGHVSRYLYDLHGMRLSFVKSSCTLLLVSLLLGF